MNEALCFCDVCHTTKFRIYIRGLQYTFECINCGEKTTPKPQIGDERILAHYEDDIE